MNRLSPLVLVALAAVTSFATPPDNALGTALKRLDGKIAIVDPSWIADARAAGWKALDIGVNLAGFITLTKASTLRFSQAEAYVIATAAGAAGLGSLIGLIGSVTLFVRGRPRVREPAAYRSKEGMNAFFRLSLDDRYRVASRDPALERYVLDLEAAHALIDAGFPATPAVP